MGKIQLIPSLSWAFCHHLFKTWTPNQRNILNAWLCRLCSQPISFLWSGNVKQETCGSIVNEILIFIVFFLLRNLNLTLLSIQNDISWLNPMVELSNKCTANGGAARIQYKCHSLSDNIRNWLQGLIFQIGMLLGSTAGAEERSGNCHQPVTS